MAGFDDLIPKAQPAIVDEGTEGAGGTEGADWSWTITGFVDSANTAINLSSGLTASCVIYDGATTVATLTVTGAADGSITISHPAASTAGLAGSLLVRRCRWACSLTKGGKTVQLWTPDKSAFVIKSKDGVA